MKLVLARVMYCLLLMSGVMLPGIANAQRAIVNGTVVDENGVPLPGANVVLYDLLIGGSTDLNGQYELSIPGRLAKGQELEVTVSFIGYNQTSRMITLERGVQTHDFLLEPNPNIGPGLLVGSPIPPVANGFQLRRDALSQAVGDSPVASLQGELAGVSVLKNSGTPGDAWSVRLRGATSITGSNQPLFIVDGVYLSADQLDLDAIDVANVEVIKGIAGATEYGSRGQAGVVIIETQRGMGDVPLNQMRITLRNEIGLNSLGQSIPINQSHNLLLSPTGEFVNFQGDVVPFGLDAVTDSGINGVTFYDNPFPNPTFNAADQFFKQGVAYTNYIGISGNNAKTNYHGSFSNLNDAGIIQPWNGFSRQTARVNVDHRVLRNLSFSGSGSFGISSNDVPTVSPLGTVSSPGAVEFNPIAAAILATPASNLKATNRTGGALNGIDAFLRYNNPFYIYENAQFSNDRTRILGHVAGLYQPVDWLTLEASAAYDRVEQDQREASDEDYVFGGSNLSPGASDFRRKGETETLMYEADARFKFDTRPFAWHARLGYRHERTEGKTRFSGTRLPESLIYSAFEFNGQSRQKILADVWIGAAGISYKNKLTLDGMYVVEGNSLFGSSERWQHYYRVRGGYDLAREGLWTIPINRFKLFAGYGTAGGRPQFDAQYPLLREAGIDLPRSELGRSQLGNTALRPEQTTGLEVGLDVAIADRVFLELLYEDRKTEDLLFFAPLPGFFNVDGQWQNGGTLESTSWEASLRATLLHNRRATLDIGLTIDMLDQELTALPMRSFTGGPFSDFYFDEGRELGTLYGSRALTSLDELPTGVDPGLFNVNDEGYVVAVGEGNTFMEGIEKNLWGTTVVVDGISYLWGVPILESNERGIWQGPIGQTLPDVTIGLPVNFRYGGWRARMLWNAQIGGDVFNFTRLMGYNVRRSADLDQAGKQDAFKKPLAYYQQLATASSHFVEDASFVKLREVAVSYTFSSRQLGNMMGNLLRQLTIGVTARNLLVTSNYSGFDPEVGSVANSAGNVGQDATLYRYDQLGYPNYRSFTAKLEIQF